MSSYGEIFASQTAATVPSARLMQNAATGNGDGDSLDTQGYATALISITASVAMTGGTKINFEVSVDDSTWVPVIGSKVGSTASGVSTEEAGDWAFSIAGYKSFRARISDYSAGTITVKGFSTVLTLASAASGSSGSNVNLAEINGTQVSQGNGTAGNGCQRVTIASDNTAFATICSGTAKGTTSAASVTVSAVDSDHNALDVYVRGGSSGGESTSIVSGSVTTYVSSDSDFTPASFPAATDIWTLFGSSTKTVKILYLGIRYTGTSSGLATFFLVRRSSTNSGGTFSSTTPAKMSSSNATATATINCYTANPSSLGTLAGQIASLSAHPFYLAASAVSFSSNPDYCLFDYRLVGQPITLSGTSEGIALNCAGTSPSGGTVKISVRVIFTEE